MTEKENRKLDLRDELRNNVEKRKKMEKQFFLEKSNAKRQQAIQMKSEIEKT